MGDAIHRLAADAAWRIRIILRARRFHSVPELIHLFKSQVLSFVEYRTVAIYHACSTHLENIDKLQHRFLRELGVTAETALLSFNLAPMSTRRDIAMLGMIHRAALGKGPCQLQQLFAPAEVVRRRPTRAGACVHDRQLREYRTGYFSELLSRSALGLVSVYNLLPQDFVNATDVSSFQKRLQCLVKTQAEAGKAGWSDILSPRVTLYNHPIRRVFA